MSEKKKGDNPVRLICAAADASLTVRGSAFDRFCSLCNSRVMIAPSGQRYAALASTEIICHNCYLTRPEFENEIALMAAGPDEMVAELQGTVTNMWRYRS